MSFDSKIMAEVARVRLTRAVRAEADAAARRRDILEALPEAADVYIAMREAAVNAARRTLDTGAAYDAEAVRATEADCRAALEHILTSAGYPPGALELRRHCKMCGDTGYIAGGTPCVCLIEDYKVIQLAELSEYIDVKNHTFDSFSLDVFSDRHDDMWGASPRMNMSTVRDQCFELCTRFDAHSHNYILIGPPGTGKTYLASCVAAELSERGHSVIYSTAADAFAAYERRKFNYDDDGAAAEIERMITCDLLIIDDLGAEFKTQFVDTAFHMLLGSRLGKNRKILICSALDEDRAGKSNEGLYTRYSKQITSRLHGDFVALPLFGNDLRRG